MPRSVFIFPSVLEQIARSIFCFSLSLSFPRGYTQKRKNDDDGESGAQETLVSDLLV